MTHRYRGEDRMSDLIAGDYHLLQVLSRFGIDLGFGDRSVLDVCRHNAVDVDTFLAVCNFISADLRPSLDEYLSLSPAAMMHFLERSHAYFLDFMLPLIRRELVSAVDCSTHNEVGFLILRFFDEYVSEVRHHMDHESTHIFRYVEGLLAGRRDPAFSLSEFVDAYSVRSHQAIDGKMTDLKNIIVRYVPPTRHSHQLNHALQDLFQFEEDLSAHCRLEDRLFLPLVSLLESRVDVADPADGDVACDEAEADKSPLSQREREIIVGVVRGQTNKEIADGLCISVHTVMTHRRNIARKLEIHSPAGLVIYAIVNGIVQVDDVKDLIP